MDLFRQGMKGPARPAPSIPKGNRYSPVTNWNDDPFGADVFEPMPHFTQKKQPPPRPPPPKMPKQPDVPLKPSHFIRRPTVLTNLLSRNRNTKTTSVTNHTNTHSQSLVNNEMDATRIFPKCEPKNIQTAALIDLSSPPSSPTFTTRSSSDGLSVDSFGSDATTSTNHHNMISGGNASQAESGFEDDFDLFLNARKTIVKDDTFDDFSTIDPFSPQPPVKPPVLRKPVLNMDLLETSNNVSQPAPQMKGPTIIRAKPTRPKPPDNSALLKTTFGNIFPVSTMNLNTTTPLHKMNNGCPDSFEPKLRSWDDESSPEREPSPPMPSIPPPPPPAEVDEDLPVWTGDLPPELEDLVSADDAEEPYAISLFDYYTDHPDDLCFSTNSRIKLIRRVDNEWLYGRLRSGAEGLFPANYVDIKVGLPNEPAAPRPATATALYHFEPDQPGDLPFAAGDTISLIYKINDEWYFGECKGLKGQFPSNYVQMN